MSVSRTKPHFFDAIPARKDVDLMSFSIGGLGEVLSGLPVLAPLCRFGGDGWRLCSGLADDLTNVGNCLTFNGMGVDGIFKDSVYVRAFKKVDCLR